MSVFLDATLRVNQFLENASQSYLPAYIREIHPCQPRRASTRKAQVKGFPATSAQTP
jgi:hypothetical protein